MTAPASDTAGPRASAPRDDLLASPSFLAACKMWETDGRAPLEFADWLRDRGMEAEADAWEWVAEDRPYDRIGRSPMWDDDPNPDNAWGWFWWTDDDQASASLPRFLRPDDNGKGPYGRVQFPTFPAAILWFLTRWSQVLRAEAGPVE